MSTALDQSLDQLTAARKGGRRGRRGPRNVSGAAPEANAVSAKPASNARARYSGTVPAANGRAPAAGATPAAPVQSDATKILVSNLPTDVNETQVKELFTSTIGPTREVTLSYDAKGHSKGTASVTFSKRGDANKAFNDYNGRLVDGKRPMKIEIIVDPSRPVALSQRVAPAPVAAPAAAAAATAPAAGANGASSGRGRGARRPGGRGRGGKKGTERPTKTVADLDAEMEDYSKTSTEAATTTA